MKPDALTGSLVRFARGVSYDDLTPSTVHAIVGNLVDTIGCEEPFPALLAHVKPPGQPAIIRSSVCALIFASSTDLKATKLIA